MSLFFVVCCCSADLSLTVGHLTAGSPDFRVGVSAAGSEADLRTPADDWRRTNRGWEVRTAWYGPAGPASTLPTSAAIHPLVLAGFQVLASIWGLLVFAPRCVHAIRPPAGAAARG